MNDDLDDGDEAPLFYYVSDEQLRVFASLSPDRRLAWLDEMRALTAELAPPEAQRWWRRFRRGG
jgi:hypothetical protein